MCGIAGIYGSVNRDTAPVMLMALALKHRGPDGVGYFADEVCALGHRRLAIIDLSERGNQPMSNEQGTIWMVVNGEIYNYKSLRISLMNRGHVFKSASDSEVIVHAYEEYGESFVEQLWGMFALAIYDQETRKLILARDRIGKKPLYYAGNGGGLVFGSEVKALLKGGVEFGVNYEAIPSYLMYQYVVGDETLFAGVKKLPAGHMLIVKDGTMRLRRYWQIEEAERFEGSLEDNSRALSALLNESVRLRLQSDVPVGVFLSGGIDSSAVAALYRKHSEDVIHTFTATFGAEQSEARYAEMVSQHLGTEYHEVEITSERVRADMPRITWHHDEPLGDAAIINNYYLAEEAKKHVTVVLAGEGGDELFGGYPWHAYSSYVGVMSRVPGIARGYGRGLLKGIGLGDVTSRWYSQGRVAMFPLQRDLEMLLYPTSAMSELTVWWLTGLRDSLHPIEVNGVKHPLNRMLASDCLNLLPEKFLMKADKGTMAWAIEERLPLLDQGIVAWAFTCPPEWKRDKRVLREALRGMLPNSIVERPKQGFGTPVETWMRSERFKALVVNRLMEGDLLIRLCRPESLAKVIRCFLEYNGRQKAALNPMSVVWALFALQVWHDVWTGKGR